MKFIPRFSSIDAAPIGDGAQVAVISPTGLAVLIEQSLFDLLFVKPEVAKFNPEDSRYRGAVIGELYRILADGPLPAGQIRERLSKFSASPQATYSALDRMKKSGRGERFYVPETGVWLWRLKSKSSTPEEVRP